jgi:hypothetical protein
MTTSLIKQKVFKSFLTSAFQQQAQGHGIIDDRLSEKTFFETYGFLREDFDTVMIGICLYVDNNDASCLENYIPK